MNQAKQLTKADMWALKEKLHEMYKKKEITYSEIQLETGVELRTAQRYISLKKKENNEYKHDIPTKHCPTLEALLKKKVSLTGNTREDEAQEKTEYLIDRGNLACYGQHRRFYRACYNHTLDFLVKELPEQKDIQSIKNQCFPEPGCDYKPTFSEEDLQRNEIHFELLRKLTEFANELKEVSIKIVVPRVSGWCAHTLHLMKSYFDLPRLKLQITDTSRTSVDEAKGDHEVDFIVAACATFLMSADSLAEKYRFGSSIYRVHQEVVAHGNVRWDSGEKYPMYFLENATGQIDYLKLAKEQGDSITKEPLYSAEEVYKKLLYANRNPNFLISLWEPKLSEAKDRYNLNVIEHHDHLVGFFVNTGRKWRDGAEEVSLGVKEHAFYELFTYASFLTRPFWPERI